MILAVEKWQPYLQHCEFTIHTDHKSLIHLEEHKISNTIQQKAFIKLLGLQYKLMYKQGTTNSAADSLSRKTADMDSHAVVVTRPRWLEIVVEGYGKDSDTKNLLQELCLNPSNDQGYTLKDGVIRLQGRIWLGNHKEAQQAILIALHDSGLGGHSGITAAYHKVKALFAWHGLKKDVTHFVTHCATCQQAKHENVKIPGLLQPLPIPPHAWHTITMDFITGLPKSNRYDTIMVVVDKFSKYAHFLPLSHPFTAMTVAQLFLNNVYKLHGMPEVIVSDRDPVFTSNIWQQLMAKADTKLNMSSANHPQTDSQTERVNQSLETYLRCMTQACPTRWFKWLPLAEYWYNTTWHSALGATQFAVLYGYKPRHFGLLQDMEVTVPDLQTWLTEKAEMQKLIQQHLLRAQQRMKQNADMKRSDREFAVGDMVYLKLQPYAQTSIARRSSQKLSFKYFGPYEVLQRIGSVAYKLKLPPGSLIHPVVHVSLLKKYLPPEEHVAVDLPAACLQEDAELQPLSILDQKLCNVGKHVHSYVQVTWTNLPSHRTTWENKRRLQQHYKVAPAWGQAGTRGEGNVTTVVMAQQGEKRGRKKKGPPDVVWACWGI